MTSPKHARLMEASRGSRWRSTKTGAAGWPSCAAAYPCRGVLEAVSEISLNMAAATTYKNAMVPVHGHPRAQMPTPSWTEHTTQRATQSVGEQSLQELRPKTALGIAQQRAPQDPPSPSACRHRTLAQHYNSIRPHILPHLQTLKVQSERTERRNRGCTHILENLQAISRHDAFLT